MRRSLTIFLFIFFVLLTFVTACKNSAKIQRLQPLKQDPFTQVYFNHNLAKGADYTEPYRRITRAGDNLEQIIIDGINSAKLSVDVAVQELRLPNIARSLAEKAKAGVKVRVVLENIYNRPWGKFTSTQVDELDERESDRYQEFIALADTNKDGKLSIQEINKGDALVILSNAGVPVIDDTADGSKGSGLMHHKFVVIDNKIVITGSANFTTSDIHGDFANPQNRGNANNLLKINSDRLANLFTQEFNLMWGDGPGGQLDSEFGIDKPLRLPQTIAIGETNVTVHFSPNSPKTEWNVTGNGLIGNTLNLATQSVNLALFVFTEQKIANILETKNQQGVKIAALIDPEFAFRNYSEGLDMLGVALANKCKYETDNQPWPIPINTVGIPQLERGDKLHHKFGVVDRQIVITGSHNWSASANYNNDETLLVLQNPTIAAHFVREFDRLYGKSVLGVPIAVQEKIRSQQQQCGLITSNSSSVSSDKLINLNTATQTELETLPGVGPKLAQKIIETRNQQPFTSLEDLERVPGIGSATIDRLQGKVTW
jgi:competence ComEA-like helix-hairpin-helix protein